jgi:DNA-binding response OmpR family regulator
MRKILVIDDDEGLRKTLDVALKYFGYEVKVASTGDVGVPLAREWKPDLVLCDVNMPGTDGRAVLQILRNDPQLANCQIVLMTGNQDAHPQREGMNLGADDYLPKPFEIGQLRTCVEARLRRATMYQRLEDGMLRRHGELFSSTLPHEFMTPLNGILGFAEILKEDLGRISREETLQMLSDIETCARRLHRTLMNYITLVTIENAPAQDPAVPRPAIAPGRATQLLGIVAHSAAQQCGRDADLTTRMEPVGLRCSENDLQTMAERLIENAFGYSLAGSPVVVSLGLQGGRPSLVVKDRGRGMKPEQIGQIGLFTQFDRRRFEQQGLGIGLAIVKRLLGKNGATISFDSTPDIGTTVTVVFEPAS